MSMMKKPLRDIYSDAIMNRNQHAMEITMGLYGMDSAFYDKNFKGMFPAEGTPMGLVNILNTPETIFPNFGKGFDTNPLFVALGFVLPTMDELERVFRTVIKQHHVDVGGDNSNTAEIIKARDYLKQYISGNSKESD